MPRCEVGLLPGGRRERSRAGVAETNGPPRRRIVAKCQVRIDRLGELGHGSCGPESDVLRDGIYELRVRLGVEQLTACSTSTMGVLWPSWPTGTSRRPKCRPTR